MGLPRRCPASRQGVCRDGTVCVPPLTVLPAAAEPRACQGCWPHRPLMHHSQEVAQLPWASLYLLPFQADRKRRSCCWPRFLCLCPSSPEARVRGSPSGPSRSGPSPKAALSLPCPGQSAGLRALEGILSLKELICKMDALKPGSRVTERGRK